MKVGGRVCWGEGRRGRTCWCGGAVVLLGSHGGLQGRRAAEGRGSEVAGRLEARRGWRIGGERGNEWRVCVVGSVVSPTWGRAVAGRRGRSAGGGEGNMGGAVLEVPACGAWAAGGAGGCTVMLCVGRSRRGGSATHSRLVCAAHGHKQKLHVRRRATLPTAARAGALLWAQVWAPAAQDTPLPRAPRCDARSGTWSTGVELRWSGSWNPGMGMARHACVPCAGGLEMEAWWQTTRRRLRRCGRRQTDRPAHQRRWWWKRKELNTGKVCVAGRGARGCGLTDSGRATTAVRATGRTPPAEQGAATLQCHNECM